MCKACPGSWMATSTPSLLPFHRWPLSLLYQQIRRFENMQFVSNMFENMQYLKHEAQGKSFYWNEYVVYFVKDEYYNVTILKQSNVIDSAICVPVLPCFGSVCLIETPGKLLWIAQFWSSFCTTKKLQRNRFLMNVYIFAPATVTWRFPGPFAHCFCTMLLAGISDIIQYLSLLHVFFNISSLQRSEYFTSMAYIAAFIACWPYHIWRAARTSKSGFLEILSKFYLTKVLTCM